MPTIVTITDPSGTAWPLDGSLGLWPMVGRKGFHAALYQHFRDESPAVDGAFWRGVRATVRELFIPIFIGGTDRTAVKTLQRNLIKAISPRNGECLITVAQPDGSVRSIRARYVDGVEAGDQGPGAWGVTAFKYGLRFIADSPYMLGPQITTAWALAQDTRTELPIPGADTFFEVVSPPLLSSTLVTTPLNSNTGFESGTTGWTATGGALTIDTVIFNSGVQSGLLTPDGVSAQASIASALLPITARHTYVAQGWLRCARARTVGINVNWYNAGSTFMTTSVGTIAVPAATWTYAAFAFVAPVAAAFASIIPAIGSTPPVTDLFWSDDVVFGEAGGNTITNPGDISVYPQWTFQGPFTAVTVQNVTTNKVWGVNWTAGSADQFILTTTPGATSLVDGAGINRWGNLTVGYQLWPLAPGDNSVNVSLVGGTAASRSLLSFQPRYESD